MMRGVLKRSRGEKRVLWGTLVASFLAGLLFVGPEFFNPSAQAMAWQSGVQIELTSAPSGAQVFIAGEHLGETPLAIRKKLSPGAYEVKLEHGELIPLVEKISIEAKQKRVSRHFPLVDFSTLALTSAPKGATVFVEEQEVGRTPLDIDSLPLSKEVKLELRLEGHDTVAIRLPKVRPLSEKQHVQMYVQNKTGKVTLQSAKELLIYKEGKRIGVTGPAPIELPAGPHVLQLVEPITGQHASQHVQVVSKATRRYYFDWSDSP